VILPAIENMTKYSHNISVIIAALCVSLGVFLPLVGLRNTDALSSLYICAALGFGMLVGGLIAGVFTTGAAFPILATMLVFSLSSAQIWMRLTIWQTSSQWMPYALYSPIGALLGVTVAKALKFDRYAPFIIDRSNRRLLAAEILACIPGFLGGAVITVTSPY
jgi:hypothetical protein